VRHTESVFGPVDILVNNAGVMYYTMMKNFHEDEWERQIDLNCKVSINTSFIGVEGGGTAAAIVRNSN